MIIPHGREQQRRSLTGWRRTTRLLQALLALSVFAAVWAVGFSGDSDLEAAPVVPETESQFSLNLKVIDAADQDLVYAVEQRARPYYRIFSLEPRTGTVETVFTVPDDAIIFGIALNPANDKLAVAYSPDFTLEGSGIWTFDLEDQTLTEVAPVTTGVYLTEVNWSPDGDSILATHVDRRSADEALSIARVDAESGSVDILQADAIAPIQVEDSVYYLAVDESKARRSIGVLDATGTSSTITVGDASYDLDHLLVGRDKETVRVAILEPEEGGITFGEPASAHGNHDVASSWWDVSVQANETPAATGLEPITVYDAATSGDAIIYATNEGLSVGNTDRIDLIKSRAIRFVAS